MAIKARKITRTAEKVKHEQLPPDVYEDEFPPKEIILDEGNKLVISCKRDLDMGLPRIDIRHFVTSDRYTGFTKKGVNFPLEFLCELVDTLSAVSDECESKGLFEEIE